MRIDHHAYQRATRVAGSGLLLQIAIGLVLLVFGLVADDIAFIFASSYVLSGTLLWLGLVIVFHQHRLERLEALEEDELTATRGAGSFFERAGDETRVAARRLMLMHKWLLPTLSLVMAALLGGLAWGLLQYFRSEGSFKLTGEKGWAIAICLFFAGVAFIFSRYVAGMAKQQAWQNLRGGAAYMVGSALVLVAVAVGQIFRYFENNVVINAMGYAIPALMTLQAAEIVLNFILNLYRPRIPGEVPRPAFDSKLLSLLATPDSIVRSLNEAVNYQFGFDVTSSWGYQLLLRSFAWLVALGVVAMVLLNTMVIIEPHQQAVKLRFGSVVGDQVHKSGVMWKLPWPIETAEVYDVTSLRKIYLTARVTEQDVLSPEQRIYLWNKSEPPKTDETLEPFIVGSPAVGLDQQRSRVVPVSLIGGEAAASPQSSPATPEDKAAAAVSNFFSLVDAEITLQYRIKQDDNGLLDFLMFAPETTARRQSLTDRERALKVLALAEVSQHLSRMSLDDVLASGRTDLTGDLIRKIQRSFDMHKTGVEVVGVNFPLLRPSGSSAPSFEEMNVSVQARLQRLAQSRGTAFKTFAYRLGNAALLDSALAGIEEYDRLRIEKGPDAPETIAKRQAVIDLLTKGGGNAAQEIAQAELDRWITLMSKKAQADRMQSQLAAYRAAPEFYRQRETMNVYKQFLPRIDKYIIAIDPSHISVDADLKKINPILEFAGASEEEKKKK